MAEVDDPVIPGDSILACGLFSHKYWRFSERLGMIPADCMA